MIAPRQSGRRLGSVGGSERGMGRLRLVEACPPSTRGAVDTIGAQAGHAWVIGQRADLVMTRAARDVVPQDQGASRPGAPLPRTVRAAEEDDRRGARAGREV